VTKNLASARGSTVLPEQSHKSPRFFDPADPHGHSLTGFSAIITLNPPFARTAEAKDAFRQGRPSAARALGGLFLRERGPTRQPLVPPFHFFYFIKYLLFLAEARRPNIKSPVSKGRGRPGVVPPKKLNFAGEIHAGFLPALRMSTMISEDE